MTNEIPGTSRSAGDQRELAVPPEMVDAPGYLLRRLYQAYQAAWLRHVDRLTTNPQMAVLLAVHNYPGVEQGALGASVSLDRSTMASIVRRLEERGLISREQPAEDGRKRLLRLTESGEETLAAVLKKARELDAILLDGYGPRGQELVVSQLTFLVHQWEQVATG